MVGRTWRRVLIPGYFEPCNFPSQVPSHDETHVPPRYWQATEVSHPEPELTAWFNKNITTLLSERRSHTPRTWSWAVVRAPDAPAPRTGSSPLALLSPISSTRTPSSGLWACLSAVVYNPCERHSCICIWAVSLTWGLWARVCGPNRCTSSFPAEQRPLAFANTPCMPPPTCHGHLGLRPRLLWRKLRRPRTCGHRPESVLPSRVCPGLTASLTAQSQSARDSGWLQARPSDSSFSWRQMCTVLGGLHPQILRPLAVKTGAIEVNPGPQLEAGVTDVTLVSVR